MPVTERTVSLKTVEDAVIVDLNRLQQCLNTIKEVENVYHDFRSELSSLTDDSANELVVDGNDILKPYFDSLLEEFSNVVGMFDAFDADEVIRTAKNENLIILKSRYDQAEAISRQNDKDKAKKAESDIKTCGNLIEENRF